MGLDPPVPGLYGLFPTTRICVVAWESLVLSNNMIQMNRLGWEEVQLWQMKWTKRSEIQNGLRDVFLRGLPSDRAASRRAFRPRIDH